MTSTTTLPEMVSPEWLAKALQDLRDKVFQKLYTPVRRPWRRG